MSFDCRFTLSGVLEFWSEFADSFESLAIDFRREISEKRVFGVEKCGKGLGRTEWNFNFMKGNYCVFFWIFYEFDAINQNGNSAGFLVLVYVWKFSISTCLFSRLENSLDYLEITWHWKLHDRTRQIQFQLDKLTTFTWPPENKLVFKKKTCQIFLTWQKLPHSLELKTKLAQFTWFGKTRQNYLTGKTSPDCLTCQKPLQC